MLDCHPSINPSTPNNFHDTNQPSIPSPVPSAPAGLEVASVDHHSAVLAWEPPEYPGGLITSFHVRCTRTHVRTHTHVCMHAHTHARTHAHTHARTHARTYACTHAHTHTHRQLDTHTHRQLDTHTQTVRHTHTQRQLDTHTQTQTVRHTHTDS